MADDKAFFRDKGSPGRKEERVTPLFAEFRAKPKPAAASPAAGKPLPQLPGLPPLPGGGPLPQLPGLPPMPGAPLQSAQGPQVAPPPPQVPVPPRAAAAPPPASPAQGVDHEILDYLKKKIGELEKKLAESQEKGLSFAFELKAREEARKESRREMEEFLTAIRQQQASSETERLRLDEIRRARERIEALESKLTAEPKAAPDPRLEALEKGLNAVSSSLSEAEARNTKELREGLEQTKQELSAGLRADLDAMRSEIRESLQAGAAEAQRSAQALDKQLDAIAFRLRESEGRNTRDMRESYERVLDALSFRLRESEAKSAREMKEGLERIRQELSAGLNSDLEAVRAELKRNLQEEYGEKLSSLEALAEKLSGNFISDLSARAGELRDAVTELSSGNATAKLEAQKTVEWAKEVLEARGRSAAEKTAAHYDFGFVQASLDNMEKALSSALEKIKPALGGGAASAQALTSAIREIERTLEVFRAMRGQKSADIKRRLTGD